MMHIRAGYEIGYECPGPTPMLLVLSIHPSRVPDLVTPHRISFDREVVPYDYVDGFGNVCTRIIAPPGRTTIRTDFVIADSGLHDVVASDARQHEITELPNDALVFLLGSRYCETDRLSDIAWSLFAKTPPGWARVQAICDHVHDWIEFGYEHACATASAWDSYTGRKGVCRDYAHLAIAFCRCMNIPARYCTGYLGDIGVPRVDPMDFSAWFEAYLGGQWYTFDARNNIPRIGRIVMARGRDATDVALSTSFGPTTLAKFDVFTDEVPQVR
ncbi:MAG: transglutaminase-like domain-containing protein [Burkholderiales bacterium]